MWSLKEIVCAIVFAAIACLLQTFWGVMNSDVTPHGWFDCLALYSTGMLFAAGVISVGWFFGIVQMNGRSTYEEFSATCGYAIRAYQGFGIGCVAYFLTMFL